MKYLGIVFCAIVLAFGLAGPAGAVNITIDDGDFGPGGDGWYGQRIGTDDQETEPGTVHTQVWDLEAFLLDDTLLSLVGGFNFKDGTQGNYSGDIFFDVGDDGWDYAIRLNFSDMTYEVFDVTEAYLIPVTESINRPQSNPYKFGSNAVELPDWAGSFSFSSGLSDAETGFLGDNHYMISGFDLGFLAGQGEFLVKFTMSCGNDNLKGVGEVVPLPGAIWLLGSGLIGLVGLRRKIS